MEPEKTPKPSISEIRELNKSKYRHVKSKVASNVSNCKPKAQKMIVCDTYWPEVIIRNTKLPFAGCIARKAEKSTEIQQYPLRATNVQAWLQKKMDPKPKK